jgi:hypothetical protein
MTEAFALSAAPERAKLDAECLERAAYLTLELLADADKAITRAKKRSQPVAGQALDVDLAEPPVCASCASPSASAWSDLLMRRFSFQVEFPLLDAGERAEIRPRMLAGSESAGIDLSELGCAHRLAGGEIRNAAPTCAASPSPRPSSANPSAWNCPRSAAFRAATPKPGRRIAA